MRSSLLNIKPEDLLQVILEKGYEPSFKVKHFSVDVLKELESDRANVFSSFFGEDEYLIQLERAHEMYESKLINYAIEYLFLALRYEESNREG